MGDGETRTATWTLGIPELSCEHSISDAIKEGNRKFRLQVAAEVWERIRGTRRIAVLDPDAWRMEATVEDTGQIDSETVELTLVPADFPCDHCEGSGSKWTQTAVDEYKEVGDCDLCDGKGRIAPHAIKGEYFVPGLGVVDGPGWHRVPTEESLSPPRHVEARWRPAT